MYLNFQVLKVLFAKKSIGQVLNLNGTLKIFLVEYRTARSNNADAVTGCSRHVRQIILKLGAKKKDLRF